MKKEISAKVISPKKRDIDEVIVMAMAPIFALIIVNIITLLVHSFSNLTKFVINEASLSTFSIGSVQLAFAITGIVTTIVAMLFYVAFLIYCLKKHPKIKRRAFTSAYVLWTIITVSIIANTVLFAIVKGRAAITDAFFTMLLCFCLVFILTVIIVLLGRIVRWQLNHEKNELAAEVGAKIIEEPAINKNDH